MNINSNIFSSPSNTTIKYGTINNNDFDENIILKPKTYTELFVHKLTFGNYNVNDFGIICNTTNALLGTCVYFNISRINTPISNPTLSINKYQLIHH
jgi:hypothetical protein